MGTDDDTDAMDGGVVVLRTHGVGDVDGARAVATLRGGLHTLSAGTLGLGDLVQFVRQTLSFAGT